MNGDAGSRNLVGQVVAGRFRVLSRIAAGGMGTVYVAEQLPLGRKVALKVLDAARPDASDLKFGTRFEREAAAVARLRHPNTIVLYDYGQTEDGLYYYAMELVEGATLYGQVVSERALSPAEAISVGIQVCGSLQEAHEAGLVHRDLKPGNVMLCRRAGEEHFVKVLDFGLVKDVGNEEGGALTRSGIVIGSPRYMAPEQVKGLAVDHRTDIYALGAVLFFALTGRAPFEMPSRYDVLRAQVEQAPPTVAQVRPALANHGRLIAAIQRCLQKDAGERFPSMAALAAELRTCTLTTIPPVSSAPPRMSGQAIQPGTFPSAPFGGGAAETKPLPEWALGSGSQASTSSTRLETLGRATLIVAAIFGLALVAGTTAFVIADTLQRAPEPVVEPTPEPEAIAPTRLVSHPVGAHVQHGEEDLGDAPLLLRIPDGERWELTLTHPERAPRTVTVQAGQGQVDVSLDPSPTPDDSMAQDPAEQAPAEVETPAERPPRPSSGRRPPPREPPRPNRPVETDETPSTTPGVDTAQRPSRPPPEQSGGGGHSEIRDPWD